MDERSFKPTGIGANVLDADVLHARSIAAERY
jgi:hypothetical protein